MKLPACKERPTKSCAHSSILRCSLDRCPSYFNLICLPSSSGSQGTAVSQTTTLCLL